MKIALRQLEYRLMQLPPWELADFLQQHAVVVSVLQDSERKRLIQAMFSRLWSFAGEKAA